MNHAPLAETRSAFMRYRGQGHEIAVPLPVRRYRAEDAAELLDAFEAAYRRLYSRVIPGVELSTYDPELRQTVHLIGLGIDTSNTELLQLLDRISKERERAAKAIIEKINEIEEIKQLGINLTYKEVQQLARGSVGHPHIADALVAEFLRKGLSKSRNMIFAEYFGEGKPAYVPYNLPTPEEGARVVHARFGPGVISAREGTGKRAVVTVEFDRVGVKKLVLGFAPLQPAGGGVDAGETPTV